MRFFGRGNCKCGHPYSAHTHYRKGTECSSCATCPRYRPA